MQASFSGRVCPFAAFKTALRTPVGLAPRALTGIPAGGYGPTLPRSRLFPRGLARSKKRLLCLTAATEEEDKPVKYNTEFGYSRKDVLLIGFGLIAVGYAMYYTAQAAGVEATTAGNYVQLFIFLVICVGYISTYIFRVANKDMTYARQLEAYEERVMQKRLEEMPETERERLLAEVESEKKTKNNRKQSE